MKTIEREHGKQHTDLGNAERLVRRHGKDLRHTKAWGHLVWDGKRWSHDGTGEFVRRAKETVRSLYADADSAKRVSEKKAIIAHAMISERRGNINAMVELAETEPEIAARTDQFDIDPMLLNVENGTLDLSTFELKEHRRRDMITKLAPVGYDPDAECPRWLAFLGHVMAGNQELVSFIQRAVGYSLTGDTREQCLFFCYGTGANGKGTLNRIVESLMGDYFKQAEFSSFLERRNDGPREDIAALVGARFVAASETGDGRKLAEGLVKTLTGQDTISTRFLHRDRFEYRPTFKLWLAANDKPVVRGTDEGIWRRIFLIPFTVTIARADQDSTLEPFMRANELPGILRWAVEGCASWLERGLAVPEEVMAATAEYREEMDTFGQFIQDQCVLDPDASESAAILLERFNASVPRMHHVSGQRMAGALRQHGFKNVRNARGVRWVGLRIRASVGSVGTSTNSDNGAHEPEIPKLPTLATQGVLLV